MKKLLLISLIPFVFFACEESKKAPTIINKWKVSHIYLGKERIDINLTKENALFQFNADSTFTTSNVEGANNAGHWDFEGGHHLNVVSSDIVAHYHVHKLTLDTMVMVQEGDDAGGLRKEMLLTKVKKQE